MGSDKRIETRTDCEGASDDWIDALAKKHSSQIPPETPSPPPSPPLPGWDAAVARMYEFEDLKPLAAMLASAEPPHWVRNQLAHLLDHKGGYSVGPDRLKFVRTKRTRRAIKTNNDKIEVGTAIMNDIERDESPIEAIGRAAREKEEKSEDYQYSYEHEGSDRVSGSRTVDSRSALVDLRRKSFRVMALLMCVWPHTGITPADAVLIRCATWACLAYDVALTERNRLQLPNPFIELG